MKRGFTPGQLDREVEALRQQIANCQHKKTRIVEELPTEHNDSAREGGIFERCAFTPCGKIVREIA